MKWTHSIISVALLVLFETALFYTAAAQNDDADDDIVPSAHFSVTTNLVTVPVSVFNEQGLVTVNLRKEDFRLWENQKPHEIRSFGVDGGSISVLLVLDTSPTSKSDLSKLKSAAANFAGKLDKGDRVSIITFDENVNLVLDWTSDTKQVKKALSNVKTGLLTALYDAMYLAANEQLRNIDGKKAIILFTDCLNNHSRVNFTEASRAIVKSQASFYLISKTAFVKEESRQHWKVAILEDVYAQVFGEEWDSVGEFFDNREKEMKDLAEQTGGRVFFPHDYNSVRNVYSEIVRELKNKYYLTYYSTNDTAPDSWRRISVEYLRPASEVLYRKGYYYLPEASRKIAGPIFAQSR